MYLILFICLLVVVQANGIITQCSTSHYFTTAAQNNGGTFGTPLGAYFYGYQTPGDLSAIANGANVDSYYGAAIDPTTKEAYVAYTKNGVVGAFLGKLELVGNPNPNPLTFSSSLTEIAPIIDGSGLPVPVQNLAFE